MHPRVILSIGNFFFSISSALISIILLPYLSTFMPAAYTGFVVAGSAVVAMALFPFLPRTVARFGAQQIAIVITLLQMILLLALAAAPSAAGGVILMTLTIVTLPFLSYELDILLEATIADTNTTGEVRALFRTAWNIAALAAPLLLGAILDNTSAYGRVFLASAAILVPIVVLFTVIRLPLGPTPRIEHMRTTLTSIVKNRDLGAVTFANLLLYLFYVWMPLYTPIYLHNVLGIPWSELGWIFAVMLVPYVLVEYPAGWIADHVLGDKELMLGGFVIAGAGLASVAFITAATAPFLILCILFGSRIGAALVESMVEGHFFRRISKRDINSVGVFRGVWPLSYLIGPVIGSVLLMLGGYTTFFLVTGLFILFAGVVATALIADFR